MSNPLSALERALEAALAARTDLDQYGDCKRALFALEMATDAVEDIHAVAADAKTDGHDDKAIDIVYVDRHQRIGYLIQAYEAKSKQTISLNKVATMHQAAGWAFGKEGNAPSKTIQAAVEEVRRALDDGDIDEFQIWFVHNLAPDRNADIELRQVAETVKGLLNDNWPLPDAARYRVRPEQISLDLLAQWYSGTKAPILADEEITLTVPGYYEVVDGNCRGVATVVGAGWLSEQLWRRQNPDDVFSANIRSFLGQDKRRNKINNGIQRTLREQPDLFWFYNNGITALVHYFTITPLDDGSSRIGIKGFSIVNGAQTAGVVKSAMKGDLDQARIPIRFIAVDNQDPETVRAITRYTNRQNATEPADFRSNDRHQRRLVDEFKAMAIAYDGARRGGFEAEHDTAPNAVSVKASSAGRALAAFHGDPGVAYLDYHQIWDVEAVYRKYFRDHTTARHILFATSLVTAITARRDEARSVADQDRTAKDRELVEFFAERGSIYLAVAGVGASMEEISSHRCDDTFALCFKDGMSMDRAVTAWQSLVSSILSYAPSAFGPVFDVPGGLRDTGTVGEHAKRFRDHISATRVGNTSCDTFAELLVTAA